MGNYASDHVFGFPVNDPIDLLDPYLAMRERERRCRESTMIKEDEVIIVNFTVVSKRTGLTYEVYAVRNSDFLIFFNKEFVWKPMSLFRPNKKTEQERLSTSETKPSMFKSQQRERVMYP